jgi:hypothetical protein
MNLQVHAKISELCILKTVVSLKLTCFPEKEKRQHFIDALHNLRSQTHKTRLTVRLQALNNLNFSVFLKCTIRSVSVQRHIHLVLHTPKKYSHIEALSKMTLEHKVYLEILKTKSNNSSQTPVSSNELQNLVQKVSSLTGDPEEEVIRKFTTFKGKEGKIVKGKTDLNDLSEKQKIVLKDKLQRLINQN